MGFVKTGAGKDTYTLFWGCKLISIRTFRIYCLILVILGTRNRSKLLLRICVFRDNLPGGSRTFCWGKWLHLTLHLETV